MQTFKFSLVLCTRENADVFNTLNENIYCIHSKRASILYTLTRKVSMGHRCPRLLPFVEGQRDNAKQHNRDLQGKTNLSEKFHDQIPRGVIQKPKWPKLSSLFVTHHLDMIKPSVKFHESIPYSL